jgi:hypothetical protein
MKNNEDINFYIVFIMCLGFTITLISVAILENKNSKLRTEVDELRLLFNEKFVQEMMVNKPVVRFEF